MSYYLASPLNLLLVLFPESILKEVFSLFILVKTGLAGSFCAYALIMINEKGEKTEKLAEPGKQREIEKP